MCGIAGVFNLNSDKNIDNVIHFMTDAMAHRGPDSDGFYIETNKIALGHRRLSIIDLSTGANQPFSDSSGRYILIFNGEIYNYLEIKKQLSEYPFKTTSDTEVILAAYLKWGKNCLNQLNGMFAFAIWDKMEQTLFVARDRLGVKPFYYFKNDNHFLFASEIRSLLSTGLIERKMDKNAVRDYLVFQSVYAPFTIIKDIFQLMPGEYATISASGIEKAFYWKVEDSQPSDDIPDLETAQKKVKKLLSESIERRMVSDVPLGAFLSGGIDSSAVVALMAQTSERPIDTFTVSFGEKEYDESRFADIISKKYNTHHTTIRLTPDDFLKELPAALDATDAPSGDGLNTYVVSKATKNAGVTVALSGLGGDELFGGYQYFQHYQNINTTFPFYWRIPLGVRHPLLFLADSVFSSNHKMERIINILDVENPTIDAVYPYFRRINTEGEADKLLKSKGSNDLIIRQLLKERKEKTMDLPLLSQVSVGEILGYTLNVLLRDTDQFSMASALEVREPFFDYKLVEYVLKVPDQFKNNKNTPKSLLVGAMGDLLPDSIVYRPKMGFSFPWRHWLLNELRPFCQEYLDYLSNYDIFNQQRIQSEWKLFVDSNGKKFSWVKIWQLVVLSYWLKKNNIE